MEEIAAHGDWAWGSQAFRCSVPFLSAPLFPTSILQLPVLLGASSLQASLSLHLACARTNPLFHLSNENLLGPPT